MLKRLLLIATAGVFLSGCFMAPMALIGPATSGWTTASLVQSGISTTANYMVKKSTGKTISQHALEVVQSDVLKQSYIPQKDSLNLTKSKLKPTK